MRRRGFTIIELLTVVGIIAVLATIVVTASAGALRHARARRADAMRVSLEQAISAYYAQEGEWPDVIERYADDANEEVHTFSARDTDSIFQDVVGKAYGKSKSARKSVLVDASALFVCDKRNIKNGEKGCFDKHGKRNEANYCGDQHCINGIDFTLAANCNGKYYIPFDRMVFGYAGPTYGKFCRFWIKYNSKTDSVTVTK